MKPHTPSLRTYQRSKESNLTVAWSSRTLVWLRYTTRPGRVHHLKPSRRTRSLITQSVRQNRVLPHGHADKHWPLCGFPAISLARERAPRNGCTPANACARACPRVPRTFFPGPGVRNYFTPTSFIFQRRHGSSQDLRGRAEVEAMHLAVRHRPGSLTSADL